MTDESLTIVSDSLDAQGHLIEAIKDLLREFGDPSKIPHEPTGVEHYRCEEDPKHQVFFRVVTFDDIDARIEVDMRDVDQEYLKQIVVELVRQIHTERTRYQNTVTEVQ